MNSKQHDFMLNFLANPQLSVGDFLKAGLSSENTSLEDESTYLNSLMITSNPYFQDSNGNFDKNKFHQTYMQAVQGMNQLNTTPLDFKAVYSKYNIWAPVDQRNNNPEFLLVKAPNPDRITKSMLVVGLNGPREFTPQEIALSLKIWDSDKLEWIDTPEDMFSFGKLFDDFSGFLSGNFGATKVMALYENDIDVNGIERGQVGFDANLIEHYKGDYKLNDNGTYYYRTLKDGENIYGKLVLHYSDILTREGSALNSIDFLDSDDILKSPLGTFVKDASLIGAMFLPYVGEVVAGATLVQQALGLGATLGKIALGSDNATMNWIEGLVEATNPMNTRSEWSSIDYGNTGRNTTWTIENLLGMAGDVIGQLKLQRLLFEYSPAIFKGKWGKNIENQKLLKEKYIKELNIASKETQLSKYDPKDVFKYMKVQKELEANNAVKAASMVEDYMKDYYKKGEVLSKAYMTLLTVNDIYGEAKEAAGSDFDAAVITAGYAAMEYALLSTDIGKWILPELRGERLQNKAMVRALTKDVRESFNSLRKAAGESDEAKRTYILKLVDFGKSVAKGEFNVGLGKRAAILDGTGLLKAGTASVMAGALAEAVEETSEEVLADFSRVLYNGLEALLGKDSKLNAFENVFDRYGMSFLGGFMGGGVSSAAFDFRNANITANMDSQQAMLQLIYKAHNNDLDGLIDIIKKEEIGNSKLSATKFDKDEKGNIIWKSGNVDDNLDLAIKKLLLNQISLIKNTLDAHGGRPDSDILDVQTLKDIRFRSLQNTTTAGLFLLKYNETLTNLVQKTLELKKLDTPQVKAENGEHDLKDEKSEDLEKRRKQLKEEIKELDKKIEEFNSGAKAPLFMATALIESTPFIAQTLMTGTFRSYVEAKTQRPFENVSEKELEELQKQYQNYLKSDKKDDLQIATKSFLIMSALAKGNLDLVQKIISDLASNAEISKMLQDVSGSLFALDFEQDLDKWQEQLGNWAASNNFKAGGTDISSMINLLYNEYKLNLKTNLDILDEAEKTQRNEELRLEEEKNAKLAEIEDKLNLGELSGETEETLQTSRAEIEREYSEKKKKLIEEVGKVRKTKEEADKSSRDDLSKRLLQTIFDIGVKQANALADAIIGQKFINGAIKNLVIDKLNTISKSLEEAYKKAENLFFNEVNTSVDFKEVLEEFGEEEAFNLAFMENSVREEARNNYKILLQQLQLLKQTKEEIDNKVEQIKKLSYTPIMENLDLFALGVGKLKLSDLLTTLGNIFSGARTNIQSFNLSGSLYKQLREAERVLDSYLVVLEAARVDNVDPFKIQFDPKTGEAIDKANVWGINRVLNEIHAKAPKPENDFWLDLPEIEGQTADMMIEDVKRIKRLLQMYKTLYNVNQGQKLNVQTRVSTKTTYLIYSKIKHLLTNVDLPDKEQFLLEIESLTFLKDMTSKDKSDWNVSLSREDLKQLEKERILMEDSIFKYFEGKLDDIDFLKKIFNPQVFEKLGDDSPTLLSEMSEDLDSSSFIGYLASKAVIKTSAFLKRFKEILKQGTIAPLIGQEIGVQLGLANILNGKAITNIITAYRESILESDKSVIIKLLTQTGVSEEAAKKMCSTEAGLRSVINNDMVPQYDNITFIDGIPGAGKSQAVDKLIYQYIKRYHPDLSDSIWAVHGGDIEDGKISKKFATDIGLPEENGFDKNTFMTSFFDGYSEPKEDNKGNKNHLKEDYLFDEDGRLQPTWKIKEGITVPKVIFIDEVQQFTLLELLALDKLAKKYGISIITSGDLSLAQILSVIDASSIVEKQNKELTEKGEELYSKENIKDAKESSIKLTRNLVLHTFKLGTSMRTANNLKNNNMASVQAVMTLGLGNIELHYFEDEKTLAGDKIVDKKDLDSLYHYLDKIIPLLKDGEKIYYAYPPGDTTISDRLRKEEKYNKYIEFKPGVALGQEGNYWIVELTDPNGSSYMKNFYTGQTRSTQFSLILSSNSVNNGKINISNVLDSETHKESYNPNGVKKYTASHVALLEEILTGPDEDIPYQERTPIDEGPLRQDTNKSPEKISEERKNRNEKTEKWLETVAKENTEIKEPTSVSSDELPPPPPLTVGEDGTIVPLEESTTKNDSEEPATEAPVAEEPTTEEPITEEPVVENPVTEEPITEEPVTETQTDIFDEEAPIVPEEINEQLEDVVSKKEIEEKLEKDNEELATEIPNVSQEFSLDEFKFLLFSNATFEVGSDDITEDGKIAKSYIPLRIDGINGALNPILTGKGWIELLRQANENGGYIDLNLLELKLGKLRRLLLSTEDKSKLESLIAEDLFGEGQSKPIYVRFAVKTTSFDLDFDEKSRAFSKFEKDSDEPTRYARALREGESTLINNRVLVAIIGSKLDIIEIPLLHFNNPITIIKSLDKDHPVKRDYFRFFNEANGKIGAKQRYALQKINETYNGKDYQGLNDLINLYLETYRHILFIPDIEWTPSKNLTKLGIPFNIKRGWGNYDIDDYVLTIPWVTINELKKDPCFSYISSPWQLLKGKEYFSYEGKAVKVANAKHPFVLVSDAAYTHDGKPINSDRTIIDEFIYLLTHNVPKTITLTYILPPQFTLREYMSSLVDFLTGVTKTSPLGNQRTAFKILEALFITTLDNPERLQQLFVRALGEDHGIALYNKTRQVVSRISSLRDADGNPDIKAQIKLLTGTAESWNEGIPKEIPLHRQLQNVLKLLVQPQVIRMETVEDGINIYTDHKGSREAHFDRYLPDLEEIFEESGTELYYQVIGNKDSNTHYKQMVPIQVGIDGNINDDRIANKQFTITGSIASSAFSTNTEFIKMLNSLLKKRQKNPSRNGYYISTEDNISYINGHSGFETNPILSIEKRTIHPSIILKLSNRFSDTTFVSELLRLLLPTKENDNSPELLFRAAELINSQVDSPVRAIVHNGELILGSNSEFKGKSFSYSINNEGKYTLKVGDNEYIGNIENGEFIGYLLDQMSTKIKYSANVSETNFKEAMDILDSIYDTLPENKTKRKIRQIKNNPKLEEVNKGLNLNAIQRFFDPKEYPNIFTPVTTSILESCPIDIKFKFM